MSWRVVTVTVCTSFFSPSVTTCMSCWVGVTHSNFVRCFLSLHLATCEQCGFVGVRHAFYSKSKRFCSLSCSRSFATAQREGRPLDGSNNPSVSKKVKSRLCNYQCNPGIGWVAFHPPFLMVTAFCCAKATVWHS